MLNAEDTGKYYLSTWGTEYWCTNGVKYLTCCFGQYDLAKNEK